MTTSHRTRALSLASVACLLLAACGSDSTATDQTPTDPPTAQADDAASADPPQDVAVRMADMAFRPASISVPAGSTVTWTNDDSTPHTVTFGDDGPASSDTIDPGETFTGTFEEAGSYSYVCILHPGMEGTVEVTEAEAARDPAPTAAGPGSATAVRDAGDHAASDAQLPGAGIPGVDIVLGEWTLVPSVEEAPPGSTTFRFRNRGTVPHALRIRTTGSGGDRREWRSPTIAPGEVGLLVADLGPGTYEVDCPVEGAHGEHDALGMEMVFTVRDGAPALAPLPGAEGAGPASPETAEPGSAVAIAAFAFEPAELRVPVGTAVAWTNNDQAPHTATGDGFDTSTLEPGATGTVTFDTAGTFDYVCAIHPTMRGRVVVES